MIRVGLMHHGTNVGTVVEWYVSNVGPGRSVCRALARVAFSFVEGVSLCLVVVVASFVEEAVFPFVVVFPLCLKKSIMTARSIFVERRSTGGF